MRIVQANNLDGLLKDPGFLDMAKVMYRSCLLILKLIHCLHREDGTGLCGKKF